MNVIQLINGWGVRKHWEWSSVLPLAKVQHWMCLMSLPQFLLFQNGDDNTTTLVGLLKGLDEMMHANFLGKVKAPDKFRGKPLWINEKPKQCYILTYTLFSFLKISFYCSRVDLQCYVSFCCMARWISFLYSCAQSLSCDRLFVTPRTAACQAPLSMGFSGQEYWSGLSLPPWIHIHTSTLFLDSFPI